ncbi:hypothetical protein E4P41_16695 [Geodermatophilus sp. DF01-2]|nr:hypothetical protein E4P41_16695 [Geodermatophilus sp. DF01_2]
MYLQLRADPDFRSGTAAKGEPGGSGEAAKPESGEAVALNANLATIFFGLVCALGGVLLSLVSQQERWIALIGAPSPGASEEVASTLVGNVPELVAVSFLGALLTAVLMANVVTFAEIGARRWRVWRMEKRSGKGRGRERQPSAAGRAWSLLAVSTVGLLAVGFWPWF